MQYVYFLTHYGAIMLKTSAVDTNDVQIKCKTLYKNT